MGQSVDGGRDLLREGRVARLATADARGRPHVVPVCFAVVDEAIYIAIDEKPKRTSPLGLRRVRNIAANPHVALLVDDYDEDWSRLRYVLAAGTARILAQGPEQRRAIDALRVKYPQYRAMGLDNHPVIEIRVERVVAWAARGGV